MERRFTPRNPWNTSRPFYFSSAPTGADGTGREGPLPRLSPRHTRAAPVATGLRHRPDRCTPRPSCCDWFFPSPDGRRWNPDNFSADLRTANQAVALVWSCLDYRHTFGSQLAQAGVSLYKISRLMGNSPEIAQRHYAAVLPHDLTTDIEFQGADSGRFHMLVR